MESLLTATDLHQIVLEIERLKREARELLGNWHVTQADRASASGAESDSIRHRDEAIAIWEGRLERLDQLEERVSAERERCRTYLAASSSAAR